MLYLRISTKTHFKKYILSTEGNNVIADGWHVNGLSDLGNTFISLIKWAPCKSKDILYEPSQTDYLTIYIDERDSKGSKCHLSQRNYLLFMHLLREAFYDSLEEYITTHVRSKYYMKDAVWDWMTKHNIEEDDISRESLVKSIIRRRNKKFKYAFNVD